MWIALKERSRVVEIHSISDVLPNNLSFSRVLGQPNFSSCNAGNRSDQMSRPISLFVDEAREILYVGDYELHRIQRFDGLNLLHSGAHPNFFFGETGITSCSSRTFHFPSQIFVDLSGNLWVVDSNHNRLLRFSEAFQNTTGFQADLVIGQQDTATCDPLYLGPQSICIAYGVTMDSEGTLFISSPEANRVTGYESASLSANFPEATILIGQPNYYSSDSSLPESLESPQFIFYDKSLLSLYVVSRGESYVYAYGNNQSAVGSNSNSSSQSQSAMKSPQQLTIFYLTASDSPLSSSTIAETPIQVTQSPSNSSTHTPSHLGSTPTSSISKESLVSSGPASDFATKSAFRSSNRGYKKSSPRTRSKTSNKRRSHSKKKKTETRSKTSRNSQKATKKADSSPAKLIELKNDEKTIFYTTVPQYIDAKDVKVKDVSKTTKGSKEGVVSSVIDIQVPKELRKLKTPLKLCFAVDKKDIPNDNDNKAKKPDGGCSEVEEEELCLSYLNDENEFECLDKDIETKKASDFKDKVIVCG
eukprot:TRINITY_DN659_c0_g1_i1.p1 TRINITY_DN659_c0_g1~~TRINITY_DN659_c0_g1_i1.p1  ORF type:complete len:565 (+),score=75.32 TRINITY_DN659_c0_g1_i1:104-1696(+)